MREKLLQLMQSEGLSSSRLAELLETQPSSISHLLSGRNKPSFDLIQKILRRFPKIDPDWLLLDSGQMLRSDRSSRTVATDLFPQTETGSVAPGTGPTASLRQPAASGAVLQQSTENGSGTAGQKPAIRQVIVFYKDGTCEIFRTRE